MLFISAILYALTASTLILAMVLHNPPLMPKLPVPKGGLALSPHRSSNALPPVNTWYYFDQRIDHEQPELGTFRQRYYFSAEYYKPGGPIVLITPGESNAEGYYVHLSNASIFGEIAIQNSGAMIMLEHRFFGESNPYPDLSVESLRVHTVQQAIDDFEYFSKHVVLPMPGGDSVGPDKAPWIVAGGSYSGALAAWAMQNKPGLFWAGYSSSGVVQTITDFWKYYEPIQTYMDRNCSADVQRVIAHVDQTIRSGNRTAIQTLKNTFGLGALEDDDAAAALTWDIQSWQSLQPRSGPVTWFHSFCDALEVKNGTVAPVNGFGLEHALSSWGTFFKTESLFLICGDQSVEACLGTHNPNNTRFSDTSVDNWERSWMWIVCNEVGWLQVGPPTNNTPALVTRLIRPTPESNYFERACNNFFPGAFSQVRPPFSRVSRTNMVYDGWSLQVERLFSANGARDPWREATLSAQGAMAGNNPAMPIRISEGFHCSDISTFNGELDASVAAVQSAAVETMKEWMAEWKHKKSLLQ